jgi:acyl-coenzyme A thioesterase PaaI-like protein
MLDMHYRNSIQWITGHGSGSGGLELQIGWDAGEAVVHLAVPAASQAAPGIAHGGFLAALADHIMGFVAAQQGGGPAVTRQMTVGYLAPTPTSRSITIRAQADTLSERTIIVGLRGSLDDSGQVTFTASGDYARVSPTRRPGSGADADYDTLEERFDPAQVFAWLTAAMRESYQPGVIGAPVLLAVEVSDATPQHWTFHATDQSLVVEAGQPASWDVRYTGTVKLWRALLYRLKNADELIAAGLAAVDDPNGLLSGFLAAVALQGSTAGRESSGP